MSKLTGINKRRAHGRWYVSIRSTGASILKGWEGSKVELARYMKTVEFRKLYLIANGELEAAANVAKTDVIDNCTLGALLAWYQSDESPRWKKLSARTKKDYRKALACLRNADLSYPAADLTTADMYRLRDAAAHAHWNKLADSLMSCLSGAFTEGVKRDLVPGNPVRGVEKLQIDDPNANREWRLDEFERVMKNAPDYLLRPYAIARFAGLRGQDIVNLQTSDYLTHVEFGRVLAFRARKNGERHFAIVGQTLEGYLTGEPQTSKFLCLNSLGRPWKTENSLQRASSDFLTGLARDGITEPGLTLHGLRVSFASAIKRAGGDDRMVADAIGDRSISMGARYTRHVEKEGNIAKVFDLITQRLENEK